MKRLVDIGVWLVAGIALLSLSWFALLPRLFFSSDTGLRYIQIQNLLANHFTSLAIRYAPSGLDGDPLQAPYYWARSLVDGEIYLHISSLFPIVSALAFAALGTLGLALLPTVGSIATGRAVSALAEICGLPRSRWIGLASIVATPLLFYALVLWDHSALTAVALWGIYGVARGVAKQSHRALLCGGAALGLATTQRPEFGALALALGAALSIHTWRQGYRPALLTAAGGVLGALPLWLLQHLWVGHFLGMAVAPHLLGYGDSPEFGRSPIDWVTKAGRFLFYVEPRPTEAPWVFATIALGIAAAAFALSRGRTREGKGIEFSGPASAGFAAMLVGYLWLARLGWDHAVIGLAATFPLLPLVVASASGGRNLGDTPSAIPLIRLLRHTALLFLLLMILAWPAYGGLQWGSRYLLPAYPLLFLLAAAGFVSRRDAMRPADRRVLVWGSAALLAVALLLQGVGVHHRLASREELADTRTALREMSVQLVATNRYFYPAMLASMADEVVFLDIVGEAELRALIPKAAAAGMTRIAVVWSPGQKIQLPDVIDGTRVVLTLGRKGVTLIELK